MIKAKGLGRGLDALLNSGGEAQTQETLATARVEQLRPGRFQPRTRMDEQSLNELAQSIRNQGLMQPILVRNAGPQGFEIIAGERRWRAAQIAGLAEVPIVVRDVPDQAALAMALIENIQREDLNPLEEARALDRLIREFDLTHEEAAAAVGRSRASVSNLLRLQELSDKVKSLLEQRKLDMGHARALLSIRDSIQQHDVARQVVQKGLSVRETEALVKRIVDGKKAPKKPTASQSGNADIRRLEQDVSEKLGARVRVEHTQKGSGKLVIAYNSLDELDGILKHIK